MYAEQGSIDPHEESWKVEGKARKGTFSFSELISVYVSQENEKVKEKVVRHEKEQVKEEKEQAKEQEQEPSGQKPSRQEPSGQEQEPSGKGPSGP